MFWDFIHKMRWITPDVINHQTIKINTVPITPVVEGVNCPRTHLLCTTNTTEVHLP
jgi:hypothetical protein